MFKNIIFLIFRNNYRKSSIGNFENQTPTEKSNWFPYQEE